MENVKSRFMSKSGELLFCRDEIEANRALDIMFALKDYIYYFPYPLIYKWRKPEQLHENKLYRLFKRLPSYNRNHPWHYYINKALIECVKMRNEDYDVERQFGLESLIYKHGGFDISVIYNSSHSLKIFSIVYAIQYLQSDPRFLDDIERCILHQYELDSLLFGNEIFKKFKAFLAKNKGDIDVEIPQCTFCKDMLDEIDWRAETCNYEDEYIERIANSQYSATEKRLVLKQIQKCIIQEAVGKNYSIKEETTKYYIEHLNEDCQEHEVEPAISHNTDCGLPSYPVKLIYRKRLRTNEVQIALCRYFQEHFFTSANIVNIRYTFFGEGVKPDYPLILKTKKKELVKFISFLVGMSVDDAIWEYFAAMIYDGGKPVFPINKDKRKSNPPSGLATPDEKSQFERIGIKDMLKIALKVKELTPEQLKDIR